MEDEINRAMKLLQEALDCEVGAAAWGDYTEREKIRQALSLLKKLSPETITTDLTISPDQ